MKHMKFIKHVMTFMLVSVALTGFSQQPFTAGNIVVFRVGNGSAVLDFNKTAVFLDEYTPAGVLVQTINMPTTTSGANSLLTATANSVSEGMINLSADGKYILVAGGNAAAGSSATPTANVIGLVDYNGNINTSTVITDNSESGRRTRTATSDNGTNIWFGTTSSIRYTTVGSTTSTLLASTTQLRNFNITNGQLYSSYVNAISAPVVGTVGVGLPATAGQTVTDLPGLSNDIQSCSQFAFADLNPAVPGPDVLYLTSAEDAADPVVGVRKFSLVGGSWVDNGSVGGDIEFTYYTGLTLSASGNTVIVYATRKGANKGTIPDVGGGDIVKIIDNSGYNATMTGTATVLASVATRFGAPNVAAFRGVALVPQTSSVKVSIKAFLQGAYSNSLSRHKDVTTTWASVLNANALSQPYSAAPFNYAGTESVSNGFFTSNSGSNTDVLDWVLLELKDASNVLVSRRAAFIREDGQIVDTDGSSAVSFTGVSAGSYYVVVKHRNHLSVRSAGTIALTSTATTYDFTTGQGQAFTNGAISNTPMAAKDLLGTSTSVTMLWGGNANSDGLVRASAGATVNDYLTLMSPANLNGNTSTILNNVYRSVDMNLDGTVRASAGANVNDYLVLMSPGILNGNTSNILTAHN